MRNKKEEEKERVQKLSVSVKCYQSIIRYSFAMPCK